MKQLLFFSDHSWAGLLLRLTLSVVMFPHGAQKLLAWFGGNGFVPTHQYLTDVVKLPSFISICVILTEFFCPLLLLPGIATRISAALLIILMIGAIATTSYSNGFFMNWFGNQKGEGFEYHIRVIGIAVVLLFTGSGKYSLDGLLQR